MSGWKPYFAIVLAQAMFSGTAILSKTAFNEGMNTCIFIFYRQAIATLFFVPFALSAARRTSPPPLPPKLLFKIFMLALIGLTINLNVYTIGIKYTSAMVASASTNSIPVFTFLISVLTGVERIRFRNISGIAKVSGFALCICGVMTIALYKGPQIKSVDNYPSFIQRSSFNDQNSTNLNDTWINGSFLVVCSAILWTLWIVLQANILKEYPSSLLFVTLISLLSAMQSFVVAIVAERHISKWKLQWDMGLLAVAYSGIFAAGIGQYLQSWCNKKKGPVFSAMFTPLALVFTITFSSILFGEAIILGSVSGGALMVGGLYSVLWGKGREAKENLKRGEAEGSLLNEEGPGPYVKL